MAMDKQLLEAFVATIPAMTVEKKVKLFLKTREAKAAATRKFEEDEAQYKQILTACESFMLRDADAQGVEGFRTPFGTTYVGESVKMSIADDVAFIAFLDAQPDPYAFFERRVAATHVQNYMKLNEGHAPAGLNIFRERVMRVRKANGKD
jgi:hypothetical protein